MRKLITSILVVAAGLGLNQNVEAQSRKITNPVKASGIASYYHNKFEGRQTSTGEIFDQDKFTAASNTLKLGEYAKVTNLSNGEVVYVRINDRMNAANKRLIDLTSQAAKSLKFQQKGITKVRVERVSASEAGPHLLAQRTAAARGNRL
ncbi:MAG: septal ring lytic transglycosylase RlpA family lipoprotein [Flavipsychrobacter sp.]|jgi:rare lipoprotein A|nr:septal ring lytic transglycosylase RlpA family lipoprotein [Flavipsychrobacter sp.]